MINYHLRSKNLACLNSAIQIIQSRDASSFVENPILNENNEFVVNLGTKLYLKENDEFNKEDLIIQITDKIEKSVEVNNELEDLLSKIQEINNIKNNKWHLNSEENTAVLDSVNAQIFKQNNNLCLSYNGKIEICQSVKDLHDKLEKLNLPIPKDISLKENNEHLKKLPNIGKSKAKPKQIPTYNERLPLKDLLKNITNNAGQSIGYNMTPEEFDEFVNSQKEYTKPKYIPTSSDSAKKMEIIYADDKKLSKEEKMKTQFVLQIPELKAYLATYKKDFVTSESPVTYESFYDMRKTFNKFIQYRKYFTKNKKYFENGLEVKNIFKKEMSLNSVYLIKVKNVNMYLTDTYSFIDDENEAYMLKSKEQADKISINLMKRWENMKNLLNISIQEKIFQKINEFVDAGTTTSSIGLATSYLGNKKDLEEELIDEANEWRSLPVKFSVGKNPSQRDAFVQWKNTLTQLVSEGDISKIYEWDADVEKHIVDAENFFEKRILSDNPAKYWFKAFSPFIDHYTGDIIDIPGYENKVAEINKQCGIDINPKEKAYSDTRLSDQNEKAFNNFKQWYKNWMYRVLDPNYVAPEFKGGRGIRKTLQPNDAVKMKKLGMDFKKLKQNTHDKEKDTLDKNKKLGKRLGGEFDTMLNTFNKDDNPLVLYKTLEGIKNKYHKQPDKFNKFVDNLIKYAKSSAFPDFNPDASNFSFWNSLKYPETKEESIFLENFYTLLKKRPLKEDDTPADFADEPVPNNTDTDFVDNLDTNADFDFTDIDTGDMDLNSSDDFGDFGTSNSYSPMDMENDNEDLESDVVVDEYRILDVISNENEDIEIKLQNLTTGKEEVKKLYEIDI